MSDRRVPEIVRNKARSVGAADWLDQLPGVIAALEQDWSVTVGATLSGGTEAFVAEATLADGSDAVLKLMIPRAGEHAHNEITVLRLTRGEGCVRLLRDDADRGAMLLERLGPSLFDLGVPLGRRHEILCRVAKQVWRPAPDAGLPTGAWKGRWLVEAITRMWGELDRPCSERAVHHAVACAERRIAAHDDERAVLVHGDVHQWNTLRAADGFKLVDPDGLLAEPEYDLGVMMREDPVELLQGDPRERARRFAAYTGCDPEAVWEWGAVERVSTGLIATQIELQPEGRQMLAAADRVCELE